MELKNKPVILIVEDEPDLRSLVAEVLSSDYNVLEAENGAVGLQLALKHKPKCVVTDIKMPKMTGLEMLKAIHAVHPEMPVIIVTGYGDAEKIKFAWDNGAFDFIDKPFTPDPLRALVERAVEFGNSARTMKKSSSSKAA